MKTPPSKALSASLQFAPSSANKRAASKRRPGRLGRSFRALSFGLAIAALTSAAQAATYYWDDNGGTPGFGAPGASDTWSATGSLFSTDATGVTAPTGAVATTTADLINFGTATLGLGTGTITVSGTVAAGSITYGAASGAITLSGGTITLGSATASGIVNNSGNIQIFNTNIALGIGQTWTLGVGATFNTGISGAFATTINATGVVNFAVSNSGDTGVATTIGGVSYVESFRLNTGVTVIGTSTSLGAGAIDFRSNLQASTALTGANKLTNTFVIPTNASNPIISGTNGIELGGAFNVSNGSPAAPTLFVTNSGGTTISGTVSLSDSATVAKGLTLDVGGAGLTISGAIQNFTTAGSGVASGLTKTDFGTLTLTGANTYTGVTTVNGGTLLVGDGTNGSLAATSALVFAGTGTLNRVQAAAAATQTFANLTFSAGAGTVQSTYGAGTTGNGGLTFTLATGGRTAGATGNFVVSGGTNGSTNKIVLTGQATGFVNKGEYFNGADFAFYDATGYVRAPIYGTDTGTSAVNTVAAATAVELNAAQAGLGSFSLTNLNLSGSGVTYGQAAGSTLTTPGIIKSSGGAGIISGGTGLTAGAAELVVRTAAAGDSLDIQTPILASSTLGLTKSGAGTLTLSAANAYTGVTTLNEGTLSVTGSIGSTGNTVINGGILSVSGAGAINPLSGTTSLITVGGASGAQGALYQSGVSSLVRNSSAGAGGIQIGGAVNAQGYYNLSGGTVSVGGEFDPGGSSGGANTFGQFDMSGGTINLGTVSATTNPFFLPVRGAAGEASVVNISGGTVQVNSGNTAANSALNGLAVGLGNVGTLNSTITISGTGQFLTPSLTTKLNDTNFGATAGNATNVSVLNLNGGTLQTLGFGTLVNTSALGSNNAVINFNGGTIRAGSAGNTAFLGGLGAVNVFSGNGTLDNNGQAITITQPLLAASGTGVSSLAVSTAGAGYTVPPRVVFSGGTTVGGFLSNTATGYATIDPTSGAVTGIVITSPGSYTSTAGLTAQLLGGGGGTTGASPGALALNSGNTSGGLTFAGAGTTTLTGLSTYTGTTAVNAGTLRVSGSLAAGSSVTVASAATLAGGAGATVGTNTIGGAVTSAGTIAPGGVGTVGTLFFGNNLSLTGGSIVLDLNGTSNVTGGTTNDLLAVTGNLAATGTVIVSPTFSATPAVNTVYTIATYGGTLTGAGSFAAGSRAITIGNTGAANGTLTLTYTGATAANLRWNSTTSGAWDVVTTPNWFNLGTSTQDLFYQGDAVTFDDTPGLQTAISVNTTVLPSSMVVNSNTNNYSFSGTGGIGGTGSLTKSGTSTLTINTANTYSGGTTINGGVVKIGNATALGASSGAVSVAAGAALDLNGTTVSNTNALTLNGTGIAGGGVLTNSSATASSYAGLVTLGGNSSIVAASGNIALTNAGTITGSGFNLTLDGAANGSIAGILGTGAGSLTKNGLGTWTLTNTSTFTGGTTINAGTLSTAFTLGAGNASLVVGANGTLNFAGNAGNTGITNTITGTGNVTNSGVAVITGDASGFAGTWTATQQNSLNTAAVGGVVPATSANAAYITNFAGTNALILGTSGIYNLGSLAGTLGELRGGNTLNGGTAVTASIGNLNTNTTFAGVIANNANTGTTVLSLTKVGTGTLTLSGANAYSGATTITGGTLAAAAATGNALASTASIAVNGGGTLLFSQPNQVLASAVASTATPAAAVTLGIAATSVGSVTAAAGASQGSAATYSGGALVAGTTAQGLGSLTLNNAATLTFGGAATTLVFNTFTPNGSVLTIGGYSNANFNAGTMTSGSGADTRLVFFGDQASNFADFNFGGGAGVGIAEVALDGGFYEVSGTAVPEPTTVLGGLLLVATAGYRQRRRLSSGWQAARRLF